MTTRITRTARVALATVLAAALGGCGDKKNEINPTIPESRPQPYIRDVPVPKKFERDEHKSTYTSMAGRRTVKDFYVGHDGLLAVRNFYFEKMPLNDWALIDEKLLSRVYVLNYKKGEQRCEIRIERMPAGGLFGGEVTQIVVTIPDTRVEAPDKDAAPPQ